MKDFNAKFQNRLVELKEINKENAFFFAYDEVINRWGLSQGERKQLIRPFLLEELNKQATDENKKQFIKNAYCFLRIKEEFIEILVKLIDTHFEEVLNEYKDKEYGEVLAFNNISKSIREITGEENYEFYDPKIKIKEELLKELQGKTDQEVQVFIKKITFYNKGNLNESLNEVLVDLLFEENLKEYKELDPISGIFLALNNLNKIIKEITGENNYKPYDKKTKIKEKFLEELKSKKDEVEEKKFLTTLDNFKGLEDHKLFSQILIDLLFERYLIEIKEVVSWGIFDSFNKLDNPNNGIIKQVTKDSNYQFYDKKAKIKEELDKELKTKTPQEKKEFINKGLDICAGNLEVLKILIEDYQADIYYKEFGDPFFFKSATLPQCLDILEYLEKIKGSDLFKQKDGQGNNIFFSIVNDHNLSSRNLSKITQFLLDKKVDPFEKNIEGISAYDRAKSLKQNDLLYLFNIYKLKKEKSNKSSYLDLASCKNPHLKR